MSSVLGGSGERRRIVIDVDDSYPTCVEFHPINAEVLAAGTYDGVIKIWRM